eukprot:CAMPEP_0169429534 /NCGR_PEP_ID=MMETSP1042-20121227/1915_1 /TAXON_ID=464988 /ORGANISM="Hemiselmis andersenii, Strain CCMP1180" /LENGTH=342 /DNA_ID=CAMNT_0009539785 /DNA_START=11 /DNA_END=1040 /DNA_ORIENTATION=-
MSGPDQAPRLSSLSHGGGCGCKIAPKVLSDILKNVPKGSLPFPSNLLVGKETSDDAAVYKLNDSQAVVVTTDFFMPIVDDEFDFGRIAATNALSDVYAMGATPICALAIVCMPLAKLDQSRICKILEGGQSVCEEAGIHIVGGHSIDGLECIYGLVAVGVMNPKNLKKNDAAKVGDAIVLGKPLGVGIYSAALKKQALSPERYHTMTKWTTKLNTAWFGLGGHSLEIAKASNTTMSIDWSKVPLVEGALELAQQGYVTGASGRNLASYGEGLEFVGSDGGGGIKELVSDPQTSGGLLVTCDAGETDKVLAAFKDKGFEGAVIGTVEAVESGKAPKVKITVSA